MKLPDFSKDTSLNTLREKASAPYGEQEFGDVWYSELGILEESGELGNLDIGDIIFSENGNLQYRNNHVVLYLRNQEEQSGEGLKKLHFYNCAIVENWRNTHMHSRNYVANISAPFVINKTRFGRSIQKGYRVDLKVCKNCLKESDYKEYNSSNYTRKDSIAQNFSREEYFGSFLIKPT